MSNANLFTIMAVMEVIIIVIVLVVILLRIKSGKIASLQNAIEHIQSKSTASENSTAVTYNQLLKTQITQTQSYLLTADDDQQSTLNKRIEFLESEILAQESNQDEVPHYWQGICSRLNLIVSHSDKQVEEDTDNADEAPDPNAIQSLEPETDPLGFEEIPLSDTEDETSDSELDSLQELPTDESDTEFDSLEELPTGETEPEFDSLEELPTEETESEFDSLQELSAEEPDTEFDSLQELSAEESDVEQESAEELDLDAVIAADLSKAMEELAPQDSDDSKEGAAAQEPDDNDGIDGQLDNVADDGIESSTEELNQEDSAQIESKVTESDDDSFIDEAASPPNSDSNIENRENHEALSTELAELQTSIAERDSELDTLKSTLADKDEELGSLSLLTEKLQQTERAHEELNSCIENLEKDNADLITQLSASPSPSDEELKSEQQNDSDAIERMGSELELSQHRIDSLHQDLNEKSNSIIDLKQEVEGLQNDLHDKIAERDKYAEAADNLTSELSIIEDSTDPDILTRQIEDLSNLIVKKSEELSTLQEEEDEADVEDGDDEFEFDFNPDTKSDSQNAPQLDAIEIPTMESEDQILPAEISQNMRDLLNSNNLGEDESDSDSTPPILTNDASP